MNSDGVDVPLCNYSCFILSLSKQLKAVTYTVENVEGGIGQDLATEMTLLGHGLNQPPVFFPSVDYCKL